MDLYKRLIGYPYDGVEYNNGEGFAKIAIYPYITVCEMQRDGVITREQAIQFLQLTQDERADHDAVIARMNDEVAPLSRHKMEDILNFVEQGWLYTTDSQLQAAFGITS